jgi:integrase
MNHIQFAIRRFKNRNGVTSWRVTGRLNGARIRKNFKTREEAAAEKSVLEIRALHAASGLQAIATALPDAQVREAEALYQRVAGKPHSLSFYVDFALANYREPESQKSLADAIAEYVSAKEHEFEQDHISRPQMGRIRWDLKKLHEHFPDRTVSDLTVSSLVAFLEVGHPALKTYNNRRGILSTFLKFAFQRGWIAENPILKVPHYRIRRRRGLAQTLTVAQARKLMEHFECFEGGRWVPYFALCLFAGIRPGVPDGEITKLQPNAVSLDTGVIAISAEVSKVREPRKVTIQPNLAAWLRAYPLDKHPIVVADFQKRRAKFSKRFGLTHDVLRHTFISMFVAKYRSMGEAALQAGNSESIIRRHYLDLKTADEAKEFFDILPKITGIIASPTAAVESHPLPAHRIASNRRQPRAA